MLVTPVAGPAVSTVAANATTGTALSSVKPETPPASVLSAVDDVSLSAAAGNASLVNPESETRLYQKSPNSQPAREQGDQQQPLAATAEEDVVTQVQEERELSEIRELKQRDQEVRAHEQAHASTGGIHAGSTSFSYETGPDGVRYAVGGEVSVDVSKVKDDPQATLEKMDQIQRAALAPAEPSSQDRQIAAEAAQKAAQALNEIAQQQLQRRDAEMGRLEEQQAETAEALEEAKAAQEEAREKESEEKAVSAAERNAEYNARMQRINEVLLEISMPPPVSAGQILDDVI